MLLLEKEWQPPNPPPPKSLVPVFICLVCEALESFWHGSSSDLSTRISPHGGFGEEMGSSPTQQKLHAFLRETAPVSSVSSQERTWDIVEMTGNSSHDQYFNGT